MHQSQGLFEAFFCLLLSRHFFAEHGLLKPSPSPSPSPWPNPKPLSSHSAGYRRT